MGSHLSREELEYISSRMNPRAILIMGTVYSVLIGYYIFNKIL